MAESKAKMNKFVVGVSHLVEKEYCTTMLYDDMYISRIMVYSQQIEVSKFKKRNGEVKSSITADGNFSNARSDGQRRRNFS